MTNPQYIAELKRALAGMDRQSRDEILREIQSHIAETSTAQSLLDRFGPATELAADYLDGQPLPAPLSRKIFGIGKGLLLGLGAAAASLVLIAAVLIWLLSGDDFDYADENASELQLSASGWTSLAWNTPVQLSVDQAHAVIYWHDDNRLSWNCRGRNSLDPTPDQPLEIRHAQCLIYLPARASSIDISQSSVVLVRPRANARLTLRQGNLRIAENGARYRYEFNLQHSEAEPFRSVDEAETLIAVRAKESSIEAYEYR